jgi:hypothetical protein
MCSPVHVSLPNLLNGFILNVVFGFKTGRWRENLLYCDVTITLLTYQFQGAESLGRK